MTYHDDQCFMCLHWRANHGDSSCRKCGCDGFTDYDDHSETPFEIVYDGFDLLVVETATDKIVARPRSQKAAEAYIDFKTAGRYDKLRERREAK